MVEVNILVDVRLVPIDQLVPVTLDAVQQGAELFDKGLSPCGMGAAEPAKWRSHLRGLLGLLPRQVEPVQGRADGLATAQAAKPRLHEADQALQRPAWFRVGAGDGWAGRVLLGRADLCAERGCDVRAKGGRPSVRRYASASGPCSL